MEGRLDPMLRILWQGRSRCYGLLFRTTCPIRLRLEEKEVSQNIVQCKLLTSAIDVSAVPEGHSSVGSIC